MIGKECLLPNDYYSKSVNNFSDSSIVSQQPDITLPNVFPVINGQQLVCGPLIMIFKEFIHKHNLGLDLILYNTMIDYNI